MILMKSDKNPVSNEHEYYEDEEKMLHLALLYAGFSVSDLREYADRVQRHIDATILYRNDPNAGKEHMLANGELLVQRGIRIENKIQKSEPGHFPLVTTTVYQDYDSANIVAQIERILPEVNNYADNSCGYGC